MLLHSVFKILLSVSYVDFPCVVAFDFAHYYRVSAHVVESTSTSVLGSAIARQRFEVCRSYASSKFSGDISLEDFSKIGESVIGH